MDSKETIAIESGVSTLEQIELSLSLPQVSRISMIFTSFPLKPLECVCRVYPIRMVTIMAFPSS